MILRLSLSTTLLLATVSACGDDLPRPPPPPTGAKPATAIKESKVRLETFPRIESAVTELEKASIRHSFDDRDFIESEHRDPFVRVQPGLDGDPQEALPRAATNRCLRADQFVASNYSYTELRLVGIIGEKTQRRVLMMDSGNLGHTVKKGDCVGRENALVKDIGAGYITFQVEPDAMGARQATEHSMPLHPNQLPLRSQPRVPDDVRVPVVAPT